MRKRVSVLLITFVILILITLLFGCAELTQAKVEQKYGPPAKKEIVDDKIIYYYYYTWRSRLPPYEPYQTCLDFTFDKNGKLINKREYLIQSDLQNKRPAPQPGIRY
jgi:hypothetical protein